MHVFGLELVELRQRLCHRLETPPTVEAYGVERGRGRDDHRRVTVVARQAFELFTEVPADAAITEAVADVKKRELGHTRADVTRDHPDSDESPVGEGSERDPPGREVPLALGALVGDRVLPLSLAEPRSRAEVADTLLEPGAVLHVHGVDLLAAVDLANPREVCADESSVDDLAAHV